MAASCGVVATRRIADASCLNTEAAFMGTRSAPRLASVRRRATTGSRPRRAISAAPSARVSTTSPANTLLRPHLSRAEPSGATDTTAPRLPTKYVTPEKNAYRSGGKAAAWKATVPDRIEVRPIPVSILPAASPITLCAMPRLKAPSAATPSPTAATSIGPKVSLSRPPMGCDSAYA